MWCRVGDCEGSQVIYTTFCFSDICTPTFDPGDGKVPEQLAIAPLKFADALITEHGDGDVLSRSFWSAYEVWRGSVERRVEELD